MKSWWPIVIFLASPFGWAQPIRPTWLHLQADSPEYISQGRSRIIATTQSQIAFIDGQILSVSVHTPNESFFIEVAAAQGEKLDVRTYRPAPRFPFNSPLKAGLSVSGNGRGCNRSDGAFAVRELGFDASSGEISRLALDFVQSCDGGPELRGAVRVNSDLKVDPIIVISDSPPSPPLSFLPHLLRLDGRPGEYISGGSTVLLTSKDAVFALASSQEGTWVRLMVRGDSLWIAQFASPIDLPLTVGHYARAVRMTLLGDKPGMSISGDGRGCNDLFGNFDVLEIERDPKTGLITRFAANFVQYCDENRSPLTGAVRYNSSLP